MQSANTQDKKIFYSGHALLLRQKRQGKRAKHKSSSWFCFGLTALILSFATWLCINSIAFRAPATANTLLMSKGFNLGNGSALDYQPLLFSQKTDRILAA